MPTPLSTSALGLLAFAALVGAAHGQDASGTMSAQMQSQTAAPAAKSAMRPNHKAKRAASTDMNTTGSGPSAAPTGPYTSTDSNEGTSDLSGSTGASIPQPAAPAPPGVAPPGGAPDTGGGQAPNLDGGPHASAL